MTNCAHATLLGIAAAAVSLRRPARRAVTQRNRTTGPAETRSPGPGDPRRVHDIRFLNPVTSTDRHVTQVISLMYDTLLNATPRRNPSRGWKVGLSARTT